MARVTITDVARQAGVSVATVSKVINGRYGVASGTSARVQHVISELGYESSLVARSLRSHRTGVIGILVADFEPFSAEILKGVATGLSGTEFELLAYSGPGVGGDTAGWEHRSLSRLSGTLIDGAILVTPTVTSPDAGIPVVAIDPHAGPAGFSTVDSDNLTGGRQATEHLLSLGHRRIALLGGRRDLESSRLREEGYRQALEAAGIAIDPELIRSGDYLRVGARNPVRFLLSLPEPPTAIFAANDLSAIGAMETAAELGLRVPDDLSVIGFDDVPEAAGAVPPLTTIRQDLQRMGELGVRLLITLLEGKTPDEEHVRLATRLVVRSSTARPRR